MHLRPRVVAGTTLMATVIVTMTLMMVLTTSVMKAPTTSLMISAAMWSNMKTTTLWSTSGITRRRTLITRIYAKVLAIMTMELTMSMISLRMTATSMPTFTTPSMSLPMTTTIAQWSSESSESSEALGILRATRLWTMLSTATSMSMVEATSTSRTATIATTMVATTTVATTTSRQHTKGSHLVALLLAAMLSNGKLQQGGMRGAWVASAREEERLCCSWMC
mmetsp:Transcript_20032/g.50815  ORF Transcript_20032/g.50815 Transcript_20032/m.50815 type:complete len:222 (-) Transcript_20032:224-889(-)